MESTDYMELIFNNTELILKPEQSEKQAIPDGYKMIMALPPQTRSALSEELVENTKDTSQGLLLTNILLQKLFATSM